MPCAIVHQVTGLVLNVIVGTCLETPFPGTDLIAVPDGQSVDRGDLYTDTGRFIDTDTRRLYTVSGRQISQRTPLALRVILKADVDKVLTRFLAQADAWSLAANDIFRTDATNRAIALKAEIDSLSTFATLIAWRQTGWPDPRNYMGN